ncbi:energy-coupling factor transporter transmembrane component T [Agromyces aerolatus]|uniref:energy-coupling factor transporter transmembrane component T n=1 Tax=Agromyces sp. LY-1074 TaxID=3074080 RepID=UPI00285C1897|nr:MULTISPECIES: energy-coupling factor transporter transmembrane component T [unclassified Agromyces]MDR5698605.1 energy-coupling factor transporter transmembrane component T [Agromyces sp. LY-1074]MDR5704899.1 energy-coupling factor transporter transmembrane component T [Agromyces sp. LY-1358]
MTRHQGPDPVAVGTTTASLGSDPRDAAPGELPAASGGRFLNRLNPLATLAATLPVMIAVIFTRDLLVPAVLLVASLALILIGARLRARAAAALVLGTPLVVGLLALSFGAWVDPARVAAVSPEASVVLVELGDWRFTLGAFLVGLATALRVVAVVMLSLITGVSTTGPELVRAMVQNLRVPYRIGYTALAALRFVPRFGHELEVIRAAHRVRGVDHGRGPVAWFRRTVGLAIPLLASAIRHAERVALAMDARAFGAHPTRTERTISRWRTRDTVFVGLCWVAAAALFWWAAVR